MMYSKVEDMLISSATVDPELPPFSEFVSYEIREIVVTINHVFLGQIIGLLGITANVMNIIVFVRQGFQDTVNISLTAIAIGDIGVLVTTQWFNICVSPWLTKADLPFLPLEIQSLTAGYPHLYFSRVTGCIMCFIAIERCLCIAIPFKVKKIITMKVTVAYSVLVYFLMTFLFIPVYYTAYFDWKLDPASNKSVLGIFYTPQKDKLLGVSLFITNLFFPVLQIAIVITSTVTIAIMLERKSSWRKSVVRDSGDISSKEKKVVVMIATVSIIFGFCLLPMTIFLTARAIEPELNITGKYANINWVVASIALLMESVNSSINIVVYYRMSSKYRETLRDILSFRLPCRHIKTHT